MPTTAAKSLAGRRPGSLRLTEGLAVTWARRAVTIPAYFLLSAVAVVGLPLFLVVAAFFDALTRRQWVFVRCVLYFTVYLSCETLGIISAFAVWLISAMAGRDRFSRTNLRLQSIWAAVLFRAGEIIFGLRVRVDDEADLNEGPIIVFVRHASIADTVLPAVFVANRCGFALRYILKRELLWDPCLDIVGNRLPNYFVRRGSADNRGEITGVAGLMENLGPREGILIYPEGTRFSRAKLERIRRRLADSGDESLARRSRELNNVLPPRLGGALALLERNAELERPADVVFFAHVGFEGAASFAEFLKGALVHREVRLRLWRVPFDDIPRDREGRSDWLYEQWQRLDDWIGRAGLQE